MLEKLNLISGFVLLTFVGTAFSIATALLLTNTLSFSFAFHFGIGVLISLFLTYKFREKISKIWISSVIVLLAAAYIFLTAGGLTLIGW